MCEIYESTCLVCGGELHHVDGLICTKCLLKLNLTNFWVERDNPMTANLRLMQPIIESGVAMFFYNEHCRDMIHRLKYRGEWQTARSLGEMLGECLCSTDIYDDVDVIVPVPLHPLRRLWRSYNQGEYIASGVAAKLGVKTNFYSLYRSRYSSPQARKSHFDRWADDAEDTFQVRGIERLRGKHILVVDDVYTSGATIFRCVDALYHSVPNCRISVATLTVSSALSKGGLV